MFMFDQQSGFISVLSAIARRGSLSLRITLGAVLICLLTMAAAQGLASYAFRSTKALAEWESYDERPDSIEYDQSNHSVSDAIVDHGRAHPFQMEMIDLDLKRKITKIVFQILINNEFALASEARIKLETRTKLGYSKNLSNKSGNRQKVHSSPALLKQGTLNTQLSDEIDINDKVVLTAKKNTNIDSFKDMSLVALAIGSLIDDLGQLERGSQFDPNRNFDPSLNPSVAKVEEDQSDEIVEKRLEQPAIQVITNDHKKSKTNPKLAMLDKQEVSADEISGLSIRAPSNLSLERLKKNNEELPQKLNNQAAKRREHTLSQNDYSTELESEKLTPEKFNVEAPNGSNENKNLDNQLASSQDKESLDIQAPETIEKNIKSEFDEKSKESGQVVDQDFSDEIEDSISQIHSAEVSPFEADIAMYNHRPVGSRDEKDLLAGADDGTNTDNNTLAPSQIGGIQVTHNGKTKTLAQTKQVKRKASKKQTAKTSDNSGSGQKPKNNEDQKPNSNNTKSIAPPMLASNSNLNPTKAFAEASGVVQKKEKQKGDLYDVVDQAQAILEEARNPAAKLNTAKLNTAKLKTVAKSNGAFDQDASSLQKIPAKQQVQAPTKPKRNTLDNSKTANKSRSKTFSSILEKSRVSFDYNSVVIAQKKNLKMSRGSKVSKNNNKNLEDFSVIFKDDLGERYQSHKGEVSLNYRVRGSYANRRIEIDPRNRSYLAIETDIFMDGHDFQNQDYVNLIKVPVLKRASFYRMLKNYQISENFATMIFQLKNEAGLFNFEDVELVNRPDAIRLAFDDNFHLIADTSDIDPHYIMFIGVNPGLVETKYLLLQADGASVTRQLTPLLSNSIFYETPQFIKEKAEYFPFEKRITAEKPASLKSSVLSIISYPLIDNADKFVTMAPKSIRVNERHYNRTSLTNYLAIDEKFNKSEDGQGSYHLVASVGIDQQGVLLPSLDYADEMMSFFNLRGDLEDSCLVEVNLPTKGLKDLEINGQGVQVAMPVNKGGQSTSNMHYSVRYFHNGLDYAVPSAGTSTILVNGHADEGAFFMKLKFQDGSILPLTMACEPNVYLTHTVL